MALDQSPRTRGSLFFYPGIGTVIQTATVPTIDWQVDRNLILRIRRAYRSAIKSFSGHGHSIWADINTKTDTIHECLINGSDDEARQILSRPQDTNLFYGFDSHYGGIIYAGDALRNVADYTFDCLVRLAEAIQATRIHTVEYGDPFPTAVANPGPNNVDDLLDLIDIKIGTGLQYPNPFKDEAGVLTKRGIISYRVPQAIYQAWRLRQLAKRSSRVLEIGAGLGRTAYYAAALGLHQYAVLDLPMTNVAQAIFLGHVLGTDAIWLPGDPEDARSSRIQILPASSINDERLQYDLVLNADSLTEMDISNARHYVNIVAKKKCKFLSINHEANSFTASSLFPSEAQVYRQPYWMRMGYVEELYDFSARKSRWLDRPWSAWSRR